VIVACEELSALLRELDAAQNARRNADDERKVEELIERIRQHREQHGTCDYKPTVQ
jgi:hypothetical protein